MRSDLITKILKETSLKTRLKVSNQMTFINLITELGYRPSKGWDVENNEEDNRILLKLTQLANEHTEHQLKTIEEWEKDGKPIDK